MKTTRILHLDLIRRSVFLCSVLLSVLFIKAQTPSTIHTSGNLVLGVCGDTILLRGINYAPYNWGSDNTQLQLNEIAQTGANAVRMTWYAYAGSTYCYTDALLDTAIATCIRNKMIPIIELHNLTCDGNTADVDTLVNWYTTPTRVAMFNKYQSSLIIDIANEVGYVNWTGSTQLAETAYQNAYDTAVRIMRNAGINVPLMIDAPDCGTSIDVLGSVAPNIISGDPLHNIIFSTHAYWYAYANNDSATMAQDITSAQAGNFPFLIGEAADYQDSTDNSGGTYYCTWKLNYPALLNICKQQNLGWLVWSWDNDQCSLRQLSSTGNYADLTTYGMDVVNNSSYGLHTTAKLTTYLSAGTCPSVTNGIENIVVEKPYLLYNDNGMAYIKSLSPETMQLQAFDILGRLVQQTEITPGQTIALNATSTGIVQVKRGNQQYVSRFVSVQ